MNVGMGQRIPVSLQPRSFGAFNLYPSPLTWLQQCNYIMVLSNTLDNVLWHDSSEGGKFVSPGAGCRIKSQKVLCLTTKNASKPCYVSGCLCPMSCLHTISPKMVHIIVLFKANFLSSYFLSKLVLSQSLASPSWGRVIWLPNTRLPWSPHQSF